MHAATCIEAYVIRHKAEDIRHNDEAAMAFSPLLSLRADTCIRHKA